MSKYFDHLIHIEGTYGDDHVITRAARFLSEEMLANAIAEFYSKSNLDCIEMLSRENEQLLLHTLELYGEAQIMDAWDAINLY